ncbi:MAG TPA: maltotransferase domain-containing protein [Xanthobacteraceae bacterium]|jgi:starch synthase (maltosyl-transferring)|nr:maltotransferase domain-containing protein [Xanthobacteraceae bacterium]
MRPNRELFAPKIYYFHPLLAGPRAGWPAHLRRCRDLGFDHVLSAPLFAPGEARDLFLAADHDQTHPAVEKSLPLAQVIDDFARTCRACGLQLFIDVVLGRVAAEAAIVRSSPGWFQSRDALAGSIDPRSSHRVAGAAYARFDEPAIADELAEWWIERLLRLTKWGVAGFRCEEPQLLPPTVWRKIIAAIKQSHPDCRFLAWTPGLDWPAIARLEGVGFDAAFSSVAWWDGRAHWIVEEYGLLRAIGSVIGCAEAPYGPRLARRLQNHPDRRRGYRHALRRAAALSHGTMMPMGIEFAATADMARRSGDDDALVAPENCTAGVAAEIRDANALTDKLASLGLDGEMRNLADAGRPVTALLRSDAMDARLAAASAVILLNTDLEREQPLPISLDPLPSAAGIAATARETISADRERDTALGAGEVRFIGARPTSPVKMRRSDAPPAKSAALRRIVIDNVAPAVDAGRFAAKHIIGESITVSADVFTDGHEMLAVELLWRAADETEWQRAAMLLLNNDRWQAAFTPDRIGRYEFTVEAWWDRYGTFCRDLEIKRKAGADLAVEITEGRQLLEQASRRTQDGDSKVIASAMTWLNDAGVEAGSEILLAHDLREVMRESEERYFLCRREPSFAVEVERPQSGFGAWYELFPRSATDDAGRHGTFDDVIARLPAIRDMGFDVLYLPPIHPIGTTNRKGKNNSLDVAADDVGSPYAIGGREGGHDAIHPALGTVEDFRRLREAAAAHGIEIALDFAIQCSPDHPWLKDHPEWFNWRPDGTVRYAENPPKKYQDIVNVDFYGPRSYPALWNELRDIVLYWRDQGVRIFRVDNPHTKPLPFWEWLIAQVRGRHPDVIFLSEAFTRPKMMYRLAKIGFTQSYTYFTWRNAKQELTEYFTELTTSEVKDYFRPHLFVNTPDINPYFLQTSGRPGFLIRAALAATLSGLWGMYSGFELCEAAPLPGREEYLDSEKYEIRVRNYDAPGNITAEIAKLNRIRKSNPALQSHLGLKFYPAHDDQVLLYGKLSADRADMILIAVNLDPFHAHDVTIELPLWEWRLPDDAAVSVSDLMRDSSFAWRGKLQRIRLDPADLPFAVWRIAPLVGG